MNTDNVSPEIKAEIMNILKQWGIEHPTDEDFLKAAREAFNVRGMVPVSPVDALLHLITMGD